MYLHLYFKYFFGWVLVLKILWKSIIFTHHCLYTVLLLRLRKETYATSQITHIGLRVFTTIKNFLWSPVLAFHGHAAVYLWRQALLLRNHACGTV